MSKRFGWLVPVLALLCALVSCGGIDRDSEESAGAVAEPVVTTRIEAESYNRYSDTTAGNTGGGCVRGSDSVDMEVTGDSAGGNCNVGWTAAGEWLEYDVTLPTSGVHSLTLRVASFFSNKTGRVLIDGVVAGTFTAPANGWQSYTNATIGNLNLTAGAHVVRVVFDTGDVNLNYISFAGPDSTARSIAQNLEAESNDGMFGVQFEACSEGGQDGGFIDTGDYLEWKIAVPTSGSYTFTSRSASVSQATYAVSVDGSQVATKTIPNTGGWQTWQSFTTSAFNLSAGTRTLRITFTSSGQNLNYAKVSAASGVPWTGSWAAAPQSCGTSFQNQTIRNVVHTSIGGTQARVQLSNAFGAQAATFRHVQIAKRATGSSIVAGTSQSVTFGGASETTVAVGAVAISDPINFNVDALSDVVISFYLPNATGNASCHDSAFQDNYIVAGDHSADTSLTSPQTRTSYFYLANLDVQNAAAVGAVVTLGASITDGYISSTNANRRWPNYLATRLGGAGRTVGVLNQGISGNKLLLDGAGQSALHRFARDVIAQPNVKWVIFSDDPINDLGSTDATATQLINGLTQLINQAHSNGIKFYCSTLTPYQGAGYWTSGDEVYRGQINDFIRGANSGCDGVVDQDLATHDPNAPTKYLAAYDAGDHLHPNESGLQAIANSVNLSLFNP